MKLLTPSKNEWAGILNLCYTYIKNPQMQVQYNLIMKSLNPTYRSIIKKSCNLAISQMEKKDPLSLNALILNNIDTSKESWERIYIALLILSTTQSFKYTGIIPDLQVWQDRHSRELIMTPTLISETIDQIIALQYWQVITRVTAEQLRYLKGKHIPDISGRYKEFFTKVKTFEV